ncbi:MAG: hypothetical protein ACJ8M1_13025 [Chthoniobacterales bacterium]
MSHPSYKVRLTPACLCLVLLSTATSLAFPTFIGVTTGVQRQAGGNPGTYTVLMNQNYATLHASAVISINGAAFKEYAMTFEGSASKNFKWTLNPAAVYPASAAVKFYFRGWDDAGANIFDGSATNPYSFAAIPPSIVAVPGDVDVYGSNLTVGSLLDDLNRAVFYLSTSDAGANSIIRFGATRSANDWIWERGSTSTAAISLPVMKLDAANRLTLFDNTVSAAPAIVLDPTSPPGIFIAGQRVLTSGAAGSFLPVNPVQLTIGVNNVAAADSLAVGSSVQSGGRNSAAFGSNTRAAGDNAVAVGDHTQAQGFGQFVTGSYNVPQGAAATSSIDDQLFVIGNGTDDLHRSNALTVLRNGNVGIGTSTPTRKLDVNGAAVVSGDLKVTGAVQMAPQGDLSMGEFTQGGNP